MRKLLTRQRLPVAAEVLILALAISCSESREANRANPFGIESGSSPAPAATPPQSPSDRRAPDARWVRGDVGWIVEILPQVEACISAAPGTAHRVLRAGTEAEDGIRLRLRNADGLTLECVIVGDTILVTETGRNLPRAPFDAGPIFTPAPETPPSGECFEHQSVADRMGSIVGWLSFDTC